MRHPSKPPEVLWFDVGIKRYTTVIDNPLVYEQLWFDVGIKRYTTARFLPKADERCGLM